MLFDTRNWMDRPIFPITMGSDFTRVPVPVDIDIVLLTKLPSSMLYSKVRLVPPETVYAVVVLSAPNTAVRVMLVLLSTERTFPEVPLQVKIDPATMQERKLAVEDPVTVALAIAVVAVPVGAIAVCFLK